MKGTYTMDKESLDEVQASAEMTSFIAAIQIPISTKTGGTVPEISDKITPDNYVSMMNKAREATTSSHSGIHYGHYTAACESEILTAVNLIFVAIPFKAGIFLKRWACSLHCMTQKVKTPT